MKHRVERERPPIGDRERGVARNVSERPNVDIECARLESAQNEYATYIGRRMRDMSNDFDSRAGDCQSGLRVRDTTAHFAGNLCIDRSHRRI